MQSSYLWLILSFSSFFLSASAQNSFEFNQTTIPAGTKQHFTIEVKSADQESFIPITVFHGKKAGKVLGITAGVHGYEYSPILAGQQLIHKIDPQQLSGTVILVQVASVGSFLGRSPYTNRLDEKNLNRVFPGDPNGTITEVIADFISNQVIARCDYFVDIHSGDGPEDLIPYSAYYQNDTKPEVSEIGRQMATHMGFDHLVIFQTTGKSYLEKGNPSLYCSAEAYKRNIPAVDIECGRLGMVETEFVDKIVVGVESLLCHLKMSPGEAIQTEGIIVFPTRTSMESNHTGFFYPSKSSGDYIKKGMKIGRITDFFNRTLEEVYAKESGVIMYMLGTPPVNKGETLVNIGIVENE